MRITLFFKIGKQKYENYFSGIFVEKTNGEIFGIFKLNKN